MNHETPEKAVCDLEHALSALTVENIRLREENEKLFRHNNVMRDLMQCEAKQRTWENRHHNSSGPVEAALDAINAGKAPADPPAVRNPCGECADPDCENCLTKNGTPTKLYDPKEAAAAMLAGRTLKDERGWIFFWKDRGSNKVGFWLRDDKDNVYPVRDFSGLYEEAKYV